MYSQEQRKIAIEIFVKFGHSYADAVAEPGRPPQSFLTRVRAHICAAAQG
jgi:hypothetical protein